MLVGNKQNINMFQLKKQKVLYLELCGIILTCPKQLLLILWKPNITFTKSEDSDKIALIYNWFGIAVSRVLLLVHGQVTDQNPFFKPNLTCHKIDILPVSHRNVVGTY